MEPSSASKVRGYTNTWMSIALLYGIPVLSSLQNCDNAALERHWSTWEWEQALKHLGVRTCRRGCSLYSRSSVSQNESCISWKSRRISLFSYLSVPSCSLFSSFLWHPLHLNSGGVGGSCLQFHPHGNGELIVVWDRRYRSFPEHHPGLFGLDEQ